MKRLERAEQYGGDDIAQMHSIYPHIVQMVKYYFTERLIVNHPLFLCAPKGTGKTWNVMKGLNDLLKERALTAEGMPPKPLMLIYKEKGMLESLAHDKLAPTSISIDRIEGDLKRRFEQANPIILDDVHYMCEDIMKGQLDSKEFISLLKLSLSRAEEGAKVLLISEDLLSGYAALLDLPELVELLPDFGMSPLYQETDRRTYYTAYKHRLNHMVYREMGSPNKEAYIKLFQIYGIKVDEDTADFIFHSTNKPRAFIKFFKIFPSKEILFSDILKEAMRRLKGDIEATEELAQSYSERWTWGKRMRTLRLKKKLEHIHLALSRVHTLKWIGISPEIFQYFKDVLGKQITLFLDNLEHIENLIKVATQDLKRPHGVQIYRWVNDLGYRFRYYSWWRVEDLIKATCGKVYTGPNLGWYELIKLVKIYYQHPRISRNAKRLKNYYKDGVKDHDELTPFSIFDLYDYFTIIEDRWLPVKPLQTLFNDELYGDIPSINLMRVNSFEKIYNERIGGRS